MTRKKMAFILTCLIFSPLVLFALFNQSTQSKIKGDEQFSLVLANFVASGQMNQSALNPNPTKTNEKPKKEKKKKKERKEHKKHELEKHAKKTIQKEIQNEQSNPAQGGAQINNSTPNQIGTLAFGKDDNPFLRAIKKAIDNALMQSYPRQALKMRQTGTVWVEFVWLQNQSLDEVRVTQSSGHKILDTHSLKIIAKAARDFPAYTENARIKIPITYNIDN